MPEFEPLRPARGAWLRRAVAGRRRLLAAVLAMAAAALAAAPRSDAEGPPSAAAPDGSAAGAPAAEAPDATVEERGGGGAGAAADGEVLAPVRIADAGVVGLLEPGDVVDVLAVGTEGGGPARIVARAARVAEIPGAAEMPEGPAAAAESTEAPDALEIPEAAGAQAPSGATGLTGWDDGTLVVLSVRRATAATLAGTAADGQLAVTLR